MGVSNRFGLYGVQVGAAGTLLGGITRQAIRLDSTVRNEPRSGDVYTRFQSLVAQKPGASFSTEHIARAIDLISQTGYDLATETTGLILYSQKAKSGGTRYSTAVHFKDQIKSGILALRRLSGQHQGDFSLDCEAVAGWNGADNPIVRTYDITAPTAATDTERFTLGKITVGGIAITHFRNMDLDFGLEIKSEGSESELWDKFVFIESIKPVLTVRGINPLWFKESGGIPLLGLNGTHANTAIFLRKRAAGGTFVADATAEHISVIGQGYITIDTPMDTGGGEAAECSLKMEFYHDGTNAPLLIDTTAAIV